MPVSWDWDSHLAILFKNRAQTTTTTITTDVQLSPEKAQLMELKCIKKLLSFSSEKLSNIVNDETSHRQIQL
jgi:hypothetical protein